LDLDIKLDNCGDNASINSNPDMTGMLMSKKI
jgi:hypothetical protein